MKRKEQSPWLGVTRAEAVYVGELVRCGCSVRVAVEAWRTMLPWARAEWLEAYA